MIDQSRPRRPSPGIAEFAPVPRERRRHDGWTPDRQQRFIAALADLGSVRAAAHAVNMTPESAYQLRRHPEGGPFREAWEAALALGIQRLEDVAPSDLSSKSGNVFSGGTARSTASKSPSIPTAN